MSIVQLESFDIAMAESWQMLSTTEFWASLPRLVRGKATARLLMVADTLKLEDIEQGFRQVAVEEAELPPGARAYRMQYDEFIRQEVDEVRYNRVYLIIDSVLSDKGLCDLLAAYGIVAHSLDVPMPIPFEEGLDAWDTVTAQDGSHWAMLRSLPVQYGSIYPAYLHRLFRLDFPIWAALNVTTFTDQEATKLLRAKSAMARYDPGRTAEAVEDSGLANSAIAQLRAEMNRAGASLHTLQFYVMVGGEEEKALATRLEIVRGTLPFELERVTPTGEYARRVFGLGALDDSSNGALLTSPGVALLTGSALSYHRRTETRGVLLGIDTNQAPVILNLFDPRAPAYNMVVLGQTGSGKTFSLLLLMLRHLLMGIRQLIIDPQGNIDLSWLGDDIYHRAVLGTRQAAVNILDIIHAEMATQVESVIAMLAMLGVIEQQDAVARSLLDDVLQDIYEPLWGQDVPVPTLNALQNRLHLLAEGAQLPAVRETALLLHYKLNPYTEGSYAGLLGRPTTVDFTLDRPVVVYDVSQLPKGMLGGNLRAALLTILVGNINQSIRRARSRGDRTPIMFAVDEFGVLMRDPVLAEHVVDEYKTARARGVGMITIDQDIPSFLGQQNERGQYPGQVILANSPYNLLFYQESSQRRLIQDAFPGLPPSLYESIFQSKAALGTCVAKLPDDVLRVHVRPSAFEYTVLSSRMQDRQRAQLVIRRMVAEVSQYD